MIKRTVLIGFALCLIINFSGCAPRDGASESTGSPPQTSSISEQPQASEASSEPVISDTDPASIVNACLDRGTNAQLIAYAEFSQKQDPAHSPFYPIDYDFIPPDPSANIDADLELARKLRSVQDVKDYFYGTFTEDAADRLLESIFNERYELYKDIDGELYVNGDIGTVGIMRWDWNRESMKIVESSEDTIIAEMRTTFRDEDSGVKWLTIRNIDGKWLMDSSFCFADAAEIPPGEYRPTFYEHILLTYGGVIHTDEKNEPYLSSTKMGLYFASDWKTPEELPVGAYFTWYLTMVLKEDLSTEELQEKYKSPFGPDTGWFFPQELFEPLVIQHFDVSTEYLRSDPNIYDAEHQGYYIGGGGGIGAVPAIVLQDIEKDGDLRKLHILLDYGDEEWAPNENKILTVRLMGQGGFRYESYVTIKD